MSERRVVSYLVAVLLAFNMETFTLDIWGQGNTELGSVMDQVKSTMKVTLWVFIGIEGAVVVSARARHRKDVGRATVIGFLICLVLLMGVSLLSLGILTQPQLAGLKNPSMAPVLEQVVGTWGAVLVYLGLIVSASGDHHIVDPTNPLIEMSPFTGLPPDKLVTLSDILSEADWRASQYYRDWCAPRGVFHVMALDIGTRDGGIYGFRVTRPEGAPPFSEADRDLCRRLHPHQQPCSPCSPFVCLVFLGRYAAMSCSSIFAFSSLSLSSF